jgi:hypothetical protein
MRSIPVDLSRITFVGSGKVISKAEYVELSNGERRASGNQAKDDAGTPLWTVDVFIDDDEARRAEAIGVTVASYDEPQTTKWRPVNFRDVTATIYVDKSSGRATVSLRAEGMADQASISHPSPVKAAS